MDYEQLGQFYLGREYDLRGGSAQPFPLLYDAKDLVTHAVCVGMTGSGKTGLGISLIEEAAIDQIPSLVIDPKGDLTNLLLTFPDLRPEDFLPWISADEALRADMPLEALAAQRAEQWKQGLATWDQSPDRIRRLRAACDFNIFTPGSDAGLPISVLSSLAAPPPGQRDDDDLFRDRVNAMATSLLTLLGIDADPIRSREHILLTNLLGAAWREGRDVDLGGLIHGVQQPPFQRVGVLDVESFFPATERSRLALAINNLLAAPGFQAWLAGEPLDVERFLYTEQSQPRVSIFWLAHLSDAERMFFLSLFLHQVISWMRGQPGRTTLRALLYIDEIFGYLPPSANPPSKKPLLTLLKQARAYGLGLVLATQNPVDLDYKALSNAGTWLLGRLQTEQDKARVLDGLQGATSAVGRGFDRRAMSDLLSAVGQRVFLLHNVHAEEPITFQTRWALSYLAGPMTRAQVKSVMEVKKRQADTRSERQLPAGTVSAETQPLPPQTGKAAGSVTHQRPLLKPGIAEAFLSPSAGEDRQPLVYEPRLWAAVDLHFVDSRRQLAADRQLQLLALFGRGPFGMDWQQAERLPPDGPVLLSEPAAGAAFAELPPPAHQPSSYKRWRRQLADFLYRHERYALIQCPLSGEVSLPGESEHDFQIRVRDRLRESRDAAMERLREKMAAKMQRVEDKLRRAERKLDREQSEAVAAGWQRDISLGVSVLSTVLGRRRLSRSTLGRVATAARGSTRARQQSQDVDRARQEVEELQGALSQLRDDVQRALDRIRDEHSIYALEYQELLLKPRRSDVRILELGLAWVPFAMTEAGDRRPLYRVAPRG